MTSDLERFIEQDGRDEAIAKVRRQIDESNITYIYYQFVSVTGRIMGKGAPADHWETIARNGFQLVYGATANLFTDRHGNYIGYGAEARELVGLPDVETFCVLPWDPKTARVFCTLFRGREEDKDPGAYLTSDCRGNLKRIHQAFEEETGYHLRVGTEPEMMWLKLNPDGTPSVDGKTRPYCYHIDQFAELQPIIHRVIEYSKAMGLDMVQGDHEDAPGQLELNFAFDRAELTADRLTTYRQICRQVGREMGAFPCFMPKPFMGVSANGCHHNISLWQGDVNVFLPDGDNPRMPSKVGLNAIGGVLEHLDALTAITAPTVNSYRRFWDTGFWAPLYADWGFQNRTTALRVSAPGRFEYRSVDSAVNPYLSFAALLTAMADGIRRNLDPGPPEERNIYDAIAAGKDVKKIPMTLGEALDALERDPVIQEALPGDMYRVYMHYKRDEWERFCATVSEWDVKEYLDILP
ncbi:glutamine synthetase [Carbonactinospora thermoautotrophica]|uniref:glutamine synthetase family protein n=1 Tax=Carbonactinospora thermoautotrophica TaxID=1469144 RepID=UPI002271E096|nr:glutamine synthetase family protein [Carbonactinospora thermoautotrophica]MCX9192288.1 glutamine synthetase [Carbonactinospora thermoautotrophica]